ncbi:tyrosine decarboxylase MfnA [Candidatus Methanocrinis natronophilus]|uniref:Probable L-tyrosine/L-aspartate decarboxylase n=1 Tax=Candidatus Methanocrinis natronophilus TaxID=3033396 RepID=A0ABT5X4K8_9EURY|nr:tyrosine decarboxylase MfnA [Candidatus Methanocrinis natronophilus]MDF0589634.1 tyrosine decarboxylase MfnA [Candidatus Methanocrinis natronophilus]
MRDQGISEEEVMEGLQRMRERDLSYHRIFSSMCTPPHPIALLAHEKFQETNLGDPGLFPGSAELELQAVGMMAELLGYPDACGYLSTGGTESNIQAIRAARNGYSFRDGNIVVPKSAHFSFDKIGDLLSLDIRKADLDDDLKVDLSSAESLIDDKTVSLVGIAGTTEFGQIDPIDEMGEIAADYGVHLHVDAAFGGFVIPFLEGDWRWDFRVEAVTSITIDPHKMGMATIPGGGLLFRRPEDLERLAAYAPYLTLARPKALTGTRSGAAAAAIWAVMNHLGKAGFKEVVGRCMDLSRRMVDGARKVGIEPVIEPVTNVVTLRMDDPEGVRADLLERRWRVSTTRSPKALRLILMPHSTAESVDLFLEDLGDVVKRRG